METQYWRRNFRE